MHLLTETLAKTHSEMQSATAGCLIQIHPMSIDAGVIRIEDDPVVIGREPSCKVQIENDSVSRQHALIEQRGRGYFITDLNSTNGVYVNDELVAEHELSAGDRLRCGNHIFRFLDQIEAQYHETVYAMMTRDGLTGALNKRYLTEILNRDIERCRRRNRPMAMILLDIDHFKKVNDTYGHLVGDEVLQELSRRIQQVIRGDELFARFGGEEFAVLVSDGDLAEARELAERCFATVGSQPFDTSTGRIVVTISVGIAEFKGDGTANSLIERADQKLYRAKQTGRNQICG